MEVRDRDLGRRDQVEVVAGDDVHLVFLVRDLAGAARGVAVDDDRRPDLGHAVLGDVDVEEPVDERRAGGGIPSPCRRGSPEPAIFAPRGRSMMSSASAISQWGLRRHVSPPAGASAPTSPSRGCSAGSSSPQVRTVTFASSPPIGTSGSAGFGMRSRRSSTSASTVAARAVDRRRSARRPRSTAALSSATSGRRAARRP